MSETASEKIYYPVYLDLHGKICVVVGGGAVALRKVNMLLQHGARLTVISPRLCAGIHKLMEKNSILAIRRAYRAGDLANAALAIVATGSQQTNREAAAEARRNRIPVNVVDNPHLSDFIVPSLVRRGDLAIAISTGGKSPALSRKIRTQLQRQFGTEYTRLTRLVGDVRAALRKQGIRPDSRNWQEALDLDELLALLRAGQEKKARQLLLARLTDRGKEPDEGN